MQKFHHSVITRTCPIAKCAPAATLSSYPGDLSTSALRQPKAAARDRPIVWSRQIGRRPPPAPSPKSLLPLIKPDVPVSGIRFPAGFTGKANDGGALRQAHRQSPSPDHGRKRNRSQGPLLRRHCSASALLRPCPTPAVTAACCDVEAAALAINGSPPITRISLATCRAHCCCLRGRPG